MDPPSLNFYTSLEFPYVRNFCPYMHYRVSTVHCVDLFINCQHIPCFLMNGNIFDCLIAICLVLTLYVDTDLT